MSFENKPKLYMLVGLPGSGKSTFAKHLQGSRFSTDDFIENEAERQGKTYNEVFKECIEPATDYFNYLLDLAINLKMNIVWDQTNLTEKSRRRKLALIPDYYEKICLYFPKNYDEVCKVNEERKKYGRGLPDVALEAMIWRLTVPKESEGFDKVYTIRF